MAATMTRWSPFAELVDVRSRLDRLFEELGDGQRAWTPAIDVVREEGKILMRADVPGVKPEDIKIEVDEGVLTISGEHEEKSEKKEKDYVRRERRFGSFSRSITLPKGVSGEDIDAKCTDGVLELTIPVPKQERKAIKITPHT